MPAPLTAGQEARAQELLGLPRGALDDDLRARARLPAGTDEAPTFGRTEFRARDLLPRGGAGQRAGACRAGGQAFGPRATRDWHTAARGRRCAWVGIGAVCAPQQGAGGAAAPGRLPHVAPAYNPRPAPPETAGEPAGAS